LSDFFASTLAAASTAALDAVAAPQPVSLGGFVFDGFEVPEVITWGGRQSLAVHKLIGGLRQIDAMGPDDADVGWSGIFLGPDASSRADQVDLMRKAGDELELVFADRYYLVVIAEFAADTRLISHVPYRITCTVVADLSQTIPAYVSPLEAVTGDLSAAYGLPVDPALATALAAISATQGLLVPLLAITAGTKATAAVAASLGAATGVISAADLVAEGQIGGLTAAAVAAGNVLGAATAIDAANALQTAAAATAVASGAVALAAYTGRAADTISRAG
jgi:hypothetical protein